MKYIPLSAAKAGVSWEGVPLGSFRKVTNHSSLLLPNIST